MEQRAKEMPSVQAPTREGQTVRIPDGYVTAEDVAALRGAALGGSDHYDCLAKLPSIAERIAALLPPTEEPR